LTYVAKVKLLAALPVPTKWTELYVGYLALSSAGERAFLSLFDCEDYALLMCHELYYKFSASYVKLSSTIYAFPSDVCMLGLQFLFESEGNDMEKLIQKASPRKKGGLRTLFRRRTVGKTDTVVVSMPHESEQEAGMRWDPEKGWLVVGSEQDLPEEHRQFMQEQKARNDGK
jgi:hypothetical protein